MIPQTGGISLPSSGESVYTGLIIDATALGVTPSISPKVLDEDHREIYGSSVVSRRSAVSSGIAAYAQDLASASEAERVADNPVVIRGLRASGANKSNIIISRSDARTLRNSSKNLAFLQECRVLIIID